jgi:hypothetical protein
MRTRPAASDEKPAARYAGRVLAVLGAIAPFENVVVVDCGLALDVGVRAVDVLAPIVAAAFAFDIVVSLALATCVLVPAAESTQAFMSLIDMRAMLSLLAFTAATIAGLVESTTAFRGGATNVVN